MKRSSYVALALGASVVLIGGPTRAQESDQRAAAQVLFDQGKALVERGKFAEACPKFRESLRLDKGIGTMLWLADCYENNGQTASAWVQFKDAAATAALAHDNRETVARDRAAKLEPALSLLSIRVPDAAALRGLEVRRDGVVVGSAEWGVGVPVDPGVHTIAATAPGREPWSSNVMIARHPGSLPVLVPVLAKSSADAPASTGSNPGRAQRFAGIGLIGLGVVGAGIGTFLGLRAKSTYDDSNAGHCLPDNECDATGKQLRHDASGLAAGSTIAFVAAAAAVAGGIIVYATAPKAPPKTSLAVTASPLSRGAALGVSGAF